MWLRVPQDDWKQCEDLQRFAYAFNNACRMVSPTADTIIKWFDGGMYSGGEGQAAMFPAEDKDFPSDVLKLVTGYMRAWRHPKYKNEMLGYLKVKLNFVLQQKLSDEVSVTGHAAHAAAKTVTGIVGRITNDLFTYPDPNALAQFVGDYCGGEAEALAIWEKMQILQVRNILYSVNCT